MKIKVYFLHVHPSVKLIKLGIVDNEGSSCCFSLFRDIYRSVPQQFILIYRIS